MAIEGIPDHISDKTWYWTFDSLSGRINLTMTSVIAVTLTAVGGTMWWMRKKLSHAQINFSKMHRCPSRGRDDISKGLKGIACRRYLVLAS